MNYTIEGEPLPVVICNLDANETMITEKGAMSWMTPNMNMETTSNGGIGKMFGRAFSGESMFQNRYTAMGGPRIEFSIFLLHVMWAINSHIFVMPQQCSCINFITKYHLSVHYTVKKILIFIYSTLQNI